VKDVVVEKKPRGLRPEINEISKTQSNFIGREVYMKGSPGGRTALPHYY